MRLSPGSTYGDPEGFVVGHPFKKRLWVRLTPLRRSAPPCDRTLHSRSCVGSRVVEVKRCLMKCGVDDKDFEAGRRMSQT